jgi:hypothetical protein
VPRSASPTFLAQLSSGQVMPVYLVELAFADNTYYLFSGQGTITPTGPAYNPLSTFPYGETFTGVGWLGKIAQVPQTTEIQAQSVALSLSGIPSTLLAEAIAQVRITGTATIWLGFFNTSTGALITDPVQIFSGSLDVPTVEDSGETGMITITAENTLLSLNLAPNRQFEDCDQQIYFPGDLGFSFVDSLPNMALFWPAPTNYGSVWPVTMSISPAGDDIPVGGTVNLSVTITYSDSSTYTAPANTGSGDPFEVVLASTNPAVAEITGSPGFTVTGRKPGTALIVAKSPVFTSGGSGTFPYGQRRCSTLIVVHS